MNFLINAFPTYTEIHNHIEYLFEILKNSSWTKYDNCNWTLYKHKSGSIFIIKSKDGFAVLVSQIVPDDDEPLIKTIGYKINNDLNVSYVFETLWFENNDFRWLSSFNSKHELWQNKFLYHEKTAQEQISKYDFKVKISNL